jgi:hypothetical protein
MRVQRRISVGQHSRCCRSRHNRVRARKLTQQMMQQPAQLCKSTQQMMQQPAAASSRLRSSIPGNTGKRHQPANMKHQEWCREWYVDTRSEAKGTLKVIQQIQDSQRKAHHLLGDQPFVCQHEADCMQRASQHHLLGDQPYVYKRASQITANPRRL